METDNPKLDLARHEAAHAVAAFFFGRLNIVFIDMQGNDNVKAFVRSRSNDREILQVLLTHHRPRALLLAKQNMLSHLAGPAADAKGKSVADWLADLQGDYGGDESDFDKAWKIAEQVYPTPPGRHPNRPWRLMRYTANLADEFVAEPRVWAVIESLASVLVERDRVAGPEARDIMQKSWGDETLPPYLMMPRWKRRFALALFRDTTEDIPCPVTKDK